MSSVPSSHGTARVADFIGLDTCLSVMQVLAEGLADSSTDRVRCCEIRRGRMASVARPNAGFYDYAREADADALTNH